MKCDKSEVDTWGVSKARDHDGQHSNHRPHHTLTHGGFPRLVFGMLSFFPQCKEIHPLYSLRKGATQSEVTGHRFMRF